MTDSHWLMMRNNSSWSHEFKLLTSCLFFIGLLPQGFSRTFSKLKNWGKYIKGPMRNRSKSKQTAWSAGKHGRPKRDWFQYFIWLVERVARVFWTNHCPGLLWTPDRKCLLGLKFLLRVLRRNYHPVFLTYKSMYNNGLKLQWIKKKKRKNLRDCQQSLVFL